MLALLMLAAAPQEARDLVHRVYDGDRLTLRLSGALLQQVDGRTYRIESLDATLYTTPDPGSTTSVRIDARAQGGTYDSQTGVMTLLGEARLASGEGDDLRSHSITVSRVVQDGRIVDFKLGTPERFTLTRPRLKVEGVGLDAHHRSLDMRVASDGRIELLGAPRDVQRGATAPADTKLLTVLESAGPMTIGRDEGGRIVMSIPSECVMTQEEWVLASGEWTLKRRSMMTAADAVFHADEIPDPADDPIARAVARGWLVADEARAVADTPAALAAAGLITTEQAAALADSTPTLLQIVSLTATGNVQLTGAEDERALCDRLMWDQPNGRTVLERGAEPVRIRQGETIVEADRVTVDHARNTAVCEGHVVGDLAAEGQTEKTHVEAESLQMEGRGPAPETAGTPSVTFRPDVLTVRSERFAELTTPRVRIRAPTISYDPENGRSVVGGPKTIELRNVDAQGNPTPPTRVTCEGVAVLDRGAPPEGNEPREGFITLEDTVRLIDAGMTLEADRTVINLIETIDPSTQETTTDTRVRAYGNVRIRKDGGEQIAADTVDYSMKSGDMIVVGYPSASIRTGGSDLLHTRTTINVAQSTLETAPGDERVKIVVPRRKKP